ELKPEIQEDTPESDTLPGDSQDISPDDDKELEPEIQDTTPEPDTLTDDSQDISLDDDTELEPEIQEDTPESDTLPGDSQDISPDDDKELEPEIQEDTPESETLPGDSQDISLDNDTELEPEIQEDTPEPEILPGDSQDISLDDSPEEILDTEEVYTDTMPEDLFSQDETQNEQEYAPNTDTEEEEYDPSLVAEAMSSGTIDDVIARHNSELADQLLMKAAGLPSDKFEMLVIDLLSKMGYFAFQTARYTTEASGSGLIHGVILDNKTGANIYIQARKLSPGRTVSKADIQDFIDELADKGGKGIFATTANFSENAQILAADERLMLIDGERLTNLMIANNFCVNVEKVYEIKAIDSESFSEYEE
ncbi:MAG: restriction endonuclease, partial [Synergistaceae bacterium]|nr:restriction endonuclease [Synergistaceae bacterium]